LIILDTNVLSALMLDEPEAAVVGWLDSQPAESVWTTSITILEARFGIALVPRGKPQRALELAFDRLVREDFENRVLDFDSAAAVEASAVAAARERAGRPVDLRDTQIAGIALARRASIATRNVRHFRDLKVSIIDPWNAPRS
jgi:toxin FitB